MTTLRVLTIVVVAGCLIEVLHRRVRLMRCYLHCTIASLHRLTESACLELVHSSTALSCFGPRRLFVAGAVVRSQGKSRAKALLWHHDVVLLALDFAVKRIGRAARCES